MLMFKSFALRIFWMSSSKYETYSRKKSFYAVEIVIHYPLMVWPFSYRSGHFYMFFKIDVLKNFANPEGLQLYWENFKNSFFVEQLRWLFLFLTMSHFIFNPFLYYKKRKHSKSSSASLIVIGVLIRVLF